MPQLNQTTQAQQLAQHEKLDVHEYLSFKNVCATKALALSKLAKDPGLKSLLEDDLRITQNQIQEIGNILSTTIQ